MFVVGAHAGAGDALEEELSAAGEEDGDDDRGGVMLQAGPQYLAQSPCVVGSQTGENEGSFEGQGFFVLDKGSEEQS